MSDRNGQACATSGCGCFLLVASMPLILLIPPLGVILFIFGVLAFVLRAFTAK